MRARHFGMLALLAAVLPVARLVAAHAFDPVVLVIEQIGGERYRVHWPRGAEALGSGDVVLQMPEHCAPSLVASPAGALVDCGSGGLAGHELSVAGPALSQRDVYVRVVRGATEVSTALHRNAPRWQVPQRLGGDSLSMLARYAVLGVEHIWFGADHLLFVLCLLLLLVGRWRDLIATLTAFTIAHSLTLGLTVTGYLRIAAPPVEALIAASLVVVAYELSRDSKPGEMSLTRRRPWLIALAFGLLHGLGFAGALREIGLPSSQLPVALLGFNLGVEIGQLLFVAAFFAPARLWARAARRAPSLRLLPAYAIGVLAMAWVFERIAAFV